MRLNSPECNDKFNTIKVRKWLMGLYLSCIAALIVSINLLVAVALLRLLLKKRNQSWCFVLNLAVADTLVGVAITGLATEDLSIRNAPTNPAGNEKTRCLFRMAFVISPCTASIMSMFLISLDRYVAIKTPLRYTRFSGKGTAFRSLLVLWISSVTIGFMPVMVRQLQSDSYHGLCTFFSVVQHMGTIVLMSCCFFPLFGMFVCIYLDILKISYRHQKHINQIRQAGSRTLDYHQDREHHHHQHLQLRNCHPGHFRAFKVVAVLIGCVVLLWCPFFVACLVHLVCKGCINTELLEDYLWQLGLLNSMINPLVYACWQREVRLQLAAMFSCFTLRLSVTGPNIPKRVTRSHRL